MCVCVNRTANLRCAVCKQLVFYANTKGMRAPVVLCSPQVCGKLIHHPTSANYLVRMWFAGVYQPLQIVSNDGNICGIPNRKVTLGWFSFLRYRPKCEIDCKNRKKKFAPIPLGKGAILQIQSVLMREST